MCVGYHQCTACENTNVYTQAPLATSIFCSCCPDGSLLFSAECHFQKAHIYVLMVFRASLLVITRANLALIALGLMGASCSCLFLSDPAGTGQAFFKNCPALALPEPQNHISLVLAIRLCSALPPTLWLQCPASTVAHGSLTVLQGC